MADKVSTKQIQYKSGFKYQLSKDCGIQTSIYPTKNLYSQFIELDTSGFLIIKSGYCWDGPSGPAIDTHTFMRGSLVHDALYQLMREGLLEQKWRIQADIELRRICLEDNMCKIRAEWVYEAVQTFAKRCAEIGHSRKTIIAPRRVK